MKFPRINGLRIGKMVFGKSGVSGRGKGDEYLSKFKRVRVSGRGRVGVSGIGKYLSRFGRFGVWGRLKSSFFNGFKLSGYNIHRRQFPRKNRLKSSFFNGLKLSGYNIHRRQFGGMRRPRLSDMDYYKILRHFTIAINILVLAFFLINYLGGIAAAWSGVTFYVFCFLVFLNTVFFAFKIRKIPEEEREGSSMIYYFSHFFLLSLIIIAVNQFLKRPWIVSHLNYISVLSVAFGFLTFYAYRDRVEREIEDERVEEEDAEKRRLGEFDWKFPFLKRFDFSYGFERFWRERNFFMLFLAGVFCPFVFLGRLPYVLGRWGYGEGWGFSIPFVVIAVAFIAIKIGMPLVFSGSYVDEYNHIMSGIEFFKSGHFAELYKGSYYNRGAYVSFLVGLFFKIFGKTIFVAKMVPAMIGTIDFFLLYGIAKRFIKRKPYILLLMLIYTISPWVILNHFYIRFYVFYEFFLLSSTFFFLKFLDYWKKKNKVKYIIYSGLFLLVNFINYFFSYDAGKYMILLVSGLFLLYFYLFEVKFNKVLKIGFLVIIAVAVWFFTDPVSKIDFLLNARATSTSPKDLKYSYYFFNLNIIFTIFFILSLSTIKRIKSKQFMIIISFLVLFLVHLVSSPDLQILRGILYFFPAYYLVSIYSVSRLNLKKWIIVVICIILLSTVVNNYPRGFLDGPYIPGEVKYMGYKNAYDYIANVTTGDIIVSGSAAYGEILYIKNNMYLLLDMSHPHTKSLIKRKKLFLDNKDAYKYSLNIPVISYGKQKKNFIDNSYIVMRQGYLLLNAHEIKEIEQTHTKKEFPNIVVYIPKNFNVTKN